MASPAAWLLARTDRANPMLVRRVRQELRNRASLGAFLLVLLVAVIAAAIAAAAGGSQAGRGLFAAIASAWTALLCLQAGAAVRAITGDRSAASWDLIELTGLPPFRIIAGAVQSSVVLGLLGGAALAPFLVMAYLLRGLDLPSVVFALVAMPLAGALLGAIAAAAACVGATRQTRQGMGLIAALALLGAWGGLTGLWVSSDQSLQPWLAEVLAGEPLALLLLMLLVNGWFAGMALALVLGTALLTHRALDRSSGPRLVWCAIWLNGLLWLGGVLLWTASGGGVRLRLASLDQVLAIAAGLGVAWSLALGLFAVSEDIDITTRQMRAITDGGLWRRRAMALFGPGAVRGTRCTLVLLAGSLALVAAQLPDTRPLLFACYGLFILALGDLLARGPLARFCPSPVQRRICTMSALVVVGLLPPIASIFLRRGEETTLLALSPFAGPFVLLDRTSVPSQVPGGWIAFTMGALGLLWLLRRALSRRTGIVRLTAGGD